MGPEQIWLIGILGFCAFIANFLYAMGGTDMGGSFGGQKWLRRFVASSILSTAANGAALYMKDWSWQYLLMYPCLIIGFSLGYGGTDNIGLKILKRTMCALGILTSCVAGLYATGFTNSGWIVTGLAGLVGLTSVIMGVKNMWSSAVVEEFLICQVLTLFIPYWAFIK